MDDKGMFKVKCSECGVKDVFVFAKDKTGNLPVAYCGKVCEGNANYKKKFDKRFV